MTLQEESQSSTQFETMTYPKVNKEVRAKTGRIKFGSSPFASKMTASTNQLH